MQIEATKQYCQLCGGEVDMPVDTLAALEAAPHGSDTSATRNSDA
jgi:hypothetical protein